MNKIEKFVAALVVPCQDVEDAFQQLLTECDLDTATATQLDQLGKLVGRPREGVTDDEVYRRLIMAQIVANRSDGLINTMHEIAGFIVADDNALLLLLNHGVAAFTYRVEDVTLSTETVYYLLKIMKQAVSAGVRIILEFWPSSDPDDLFTFDGTAEGAGFDDAVAGGIGGFFISGMD